jgi:type IV pilus assembly protein PilB
MSKDVQSINDLISSSHGRHGDGTPQAKLAGQEEKIKIASIEKEVSNQAQASGLPYINLKGFPISPESLILVKEEEAMELKTVCFFYDGEHLRLGTVDPSNSAVNILAEKLKDKHAGDVAIYLISEYSLKHALKLYSIIPKTREFIAGVKISEEDLNKYSENFLSFKDLAGVIRKAPTSDIITVVLAAAIKSGSSDIHIEGEEADIKIRFRVDGVLYDAAIIDKELWKKIISRLKLLAGVKLNVTDKPQDGRISIFLTNDHVDIRASFLPTAFGESVVMRLLRSSSVGLTFNDLGLRGRAYETLKREVERPNGMVVTTGPTGSGKTTTLYAILKKLNDTETKIITVEDPIEYQLAGINQSQASAKYTFAQGLRSIVRQDPDVIMIGEIRDLETAEIAIQAALTGHLVLSTIHTNDAAGTVPRFLSIGVKPFLLAPAINAIIGQRLVRRLCQKCKTPGNPDEEFLTRVLVGLKKLPEAEKKEVKEKFNLDLDLDDATLKNNLGSKFYKSQGCDTCQGTGYKGRVGIYEIMTMNPEIEKIILSGSASEYDMRDIATKNGMVTMAQDGLLRALEGVTSVEEVFRVAE